MTNLHDPVEVLRRVDTRLRALADPAQAAQMGAYQRGQFAFLGVHTPARRQLVRDCARGLAWPGVLTVAEHLWDAPEREFQYAAIDVLDLHRRQLPLDAVAPLLALARRKPWWETVDGLAGVIGKLLRAQLDESPDVQRPMDAALADDCFWIRHIAMLHQLGWRLRTDEARLFGYALRLAPESEFFIRKAIGWALRDYGRWAPDAVQGFVAEHREQLSALTVREALKRLS